MDREVVIRGVSSCHWIGLVGGRGETRSYKIVSPPKLMGHCNILVTVAVAEAKKGSWAQNYEGGKMKREDKQSKNKFMKPLPVVIQ